MAASSVNPSPDVSEREGEEAIDRLKSANPLLYLTPSPELSRHARIASSYLFSALLPYCPKKPLLDRLLIGDEFDAEQIWSQIDEISRPIVSMLQREVKRLAREPPVAMPAEVKEKKGSKEAEDEEDEDVAMESEDEDEDEDEDGDDDESGEEEEEEEEEEEAVAGANGGVEDRFLKIKELEEYLAKDEAKEYGQPEKKTRRKKDEKEGDEEEEEDDGEDDDDDLEFGSFDDDDNGEGDLGESARYEDFFVSNKKKQGGAKKEGSVKEKGSSKKVKFADELEDFADEMDDEEKDNGDANPQDGVLSTHEKEQRKIQSKIEQMEKESLEPKAWTMQGEVTAAKRPKNSALEVDLDFEHNMRPAPVITEEVTASLEDLIRKRIIEGQFDDVQRAPALPSQVPKERQELDENKSKKGLAEIYEEDYAKKAGLISVPLSSSDEQKKEATILFKNLCLKLDALAHFHFAPKPIIEDMSIQTNVPALAMEEIAPLAVSDAAMLAPEEIFEGKGDIKEETELTQAERKRRRANKKRRYKAGESKKAAKRARVNADQSHPYRTKIDT